MVLRYGVLANLYNEYGFLENNVDFIASYVMQYEEQTALLDAYNTIEADISSQLIDENRNAIATLNGNYDTGEVWYVVKNNTDYTYSTVFEFYFYDEDGLLLEENMTEITNIQPGTSYKTSVYVSCGLDNISSHSFANFYTDVVINEVSDSSAATSDVDIVENHYDITEQEAKLYANVLNTYYSIQQIHLNPESFEWLGAVVNNDSKRTTIHISYTGGDNQIYTDYFWKDLDGSNISNVFGESNYGNENLSLSPLDINEILYFEKYCGYEQELVPSENIELEY